MLRCDKLSCPCIPDTDAGTSRSRILPTCPGITSLSVRMGLNKVVWHTDTETKKETERLTETQRHNKFVCPEVVWHTRLLKCPGTPKTPLRHSAVMAVTKDKQSLCCEYFYKRHFPLSLSLSQKPIACTQIAAAEA